MDIKELLQLLHRLISSSRENEYIEFKENNYQVEEIGKRISALANGAALVGQQYGYLVFGVEDNTHIIVGTNFDPKKEKRGNEEFEHWLSQRLSPKIDFRIYNFDYNGKKLVLFHIPAAKGNRCVLSMLHLYVWEVLLVVSKIIPKKNASFGKTLPTNLK